MGEEKTIAEQISVQCKILDPKPGQILVIEYPPGDVLACEACREAGRGIAEQSDVQVFLCPSPFTIQAVDSVLMKHVDELKRTFKLAIDEKDAEIAKLTWELNN